MSFGKMFLAVFLAVLAAGGIFAAMHYSEVHEAAAEAAQKAVDDDHAAAVLEHAEHQAKMESMDQEIRELEPNSPCNPLAGEAFTKCTNLSSRQEKKKYAAGVLSASKKASLVKTSAN